MSSGKGRPSAETVAVSVCSVIHLARSSEKIPFVGLQNELVDNVEELSVFVLHPEVESTNNRSERQARPEAMALHAPYVLSPDGFSLNHRPAHLTCLHTSREDRRVRGVAFEDEDSVKNGEPTA